MKLTELRHEHDHLEFLYRALLDSYRSDSWEQVRTRWDHAERTLREHMTTEERLILPSFAQSHPKEAEGLMAEHAALRKQLSTFGVNVELHALPLGDVEALVASTRAHSQREQCLLDSWLATAGMRSIEAHDAELEQRLPSRTDAFSLFRGAHRHIFSG